MNYSPSNLLSGSPSNPFSWKFLRKDDLVGIGVGPPIQDHSPLCITSNTDHCLLFVRRTLPLTHLPSLEIHVIRCRERSSSRSDPSVQKRSHGQNHRSSCAYMRHVSLKILPLLLKFATTRQRKPFFHSLLIYDPCYRESLTRLGFRVFFWLITSVWPLDCNSSFFNEISYLIWKFLLYHSLYFFLSAIGPFFNVFLSLDGGIESTSMSSSAF